MRGMRIETGPDGVDRCWWGTSDDDYLTYHDLEWGRPTLDDSLIFEKVCLEGFQAGLSWLTILRKRDRFREVFDGFQIEKVAAFTDSDVDRLLADAGIVRHEGKIRSTINNATRALELRDEHGGLASFFWQSATPPGSKPPSEIDAMTAASTDLSKHLKRLGWSFVGPTTIYAFMQAMGLVNDHLEGCVAREDCEHEREQAWMTLGLAR